MLLDVCARRRFDRRLVGGKRDLRGPQEVAGATAAARQEREQRDRTGGAPARGRSSRSAGQTIAADASGNLFVSGLFNGALDIQDPPLLNESPKYQAFLAKLGPDGTTAWARQYANLEIFAIEAGPDGSVYLAGTASGEVDLGAGPVPTSGTRDAVIARLDADGNHVWSRVFVAPVGDQTAVGVAPTSSGVWLGIDFEGQVDLGGGEHVTAGGYDVAAARYVD